MKLQIASTILNVFLNWILIFECELGISGAALASGISRWIVVLIGVPMLIAELPPRWKTPFDTKKILAMGFPVASGTILYSGVYWAIMYLCISPLGNAVHVALGLGFSVLEGISYPLYAGVMMATSSMIGRQLGAKDEQGLDETIKKGSVLSLGLGFSAMIVFLFCAEFICTQFTKSEAALEQAVLYAHILAYSQVFVALEAMSEGVLSGSGDNKRLFWLSAPLNILRIPLAYIFCFSFGAKAAGIWWAINLTTYIKCALKWNAIRVGKWRKVNL
jgi:putative MATE family efflux protein